MPPTKLNRNAGVKTSPPNAAPTISANDVPAGKANVDTPTFIDISTIGTRDIEMTREDQVVDRVVGSTQIMKVVPVTVREPNVNQPYLTLEEARQLGKNPPGGWHPYAFGKNQMTCVVHFRRFIVNADVYGALIAGE
jgi:hypothetical protein